MENNLKKMNGFVSFMLCLVMVVNTLRTVDYAVHMFDQYTGIMTLRYSCNCLLSVLNVFGAYLLLKWNKIGFYVMILTAFLATAYNIYVMEKYSFMILQPLCVIVILWAILQIKKDGVSVWRQLHTILNEKQFRNAYLILGAAIIIIFLITLLAYNNAGPSISPPDKETFNSH